MDHNEDCITIEKEDIPSLFLVEKLESLSIWYTGGEKIKTRRLNTRNFE